MKKKSSSIQRSVMRQISSGRVHMHSRLYFSLITVAAVGAGVAGGILFAYVVDIATYIIRIQASATPAYGARSNLADSLASFPWWALLLAVACITLAVWLMRRYGRAYRHTPAIVAIFLLVSVVLGVGFSFTDLGGHDEGQYMRGRGSHTIR
jgi:cytochrome bd-type quinol oxidase subunit 2